MRAHIIICNTSFDRRKNRDSSDTMYAIPDSKELDLLALEFDAFCLCNGTRIRMTTVAETQCIEFEGEQVELF